MTAETAAERQQREADFRHRMKRDGDLGLLLCGYLWGNFDTLHLAGEEFEMADPGGVPGYEDDNFAVLLRRRSDGQVFDAEIDVSMHPVRGSAEVTR